MSDQPHIMIALSRYYEEVASELLAGTLGVLEEAGATHELYEIPGAFEIPAAIAIAMRSPEFSGGRRRFDGYIALGCVTNLGSRNFTKFHSSNMEFQRHYLK